MAILTALAAGAGAISSLAGAFGGGDSPGPAPPGVQESGQITIGGLTVPEYPYKGGAPGAVYGDLRDNPAAMAAFTAVAVAVLFALKRRKK